MRDENSYAAFFELFFLEFDFVLFFTKAFFVNLAATLGVAVLLLLRGLADFRAVGLLEDFQFLLVVDFANDFFEALTVGLTVDFLAIDFLAIDFLAIGLAATIFFTVDFLATDFLATAFLAAGLAVVFVEVAFLAVAFLAVDFLAVAFLAVDFFALDFFVVTLGVLLEEFELLQFHPPLFQLAEKTKYPTS